MEYDLRTKKKMNPLQNKKCIPCEKGTKPLSHDEVEKYFKNLKGWINNEDTQLQKNLKFVDFKHALGFINEVGDIAEFEGHHPDMFLHNWNQVSLTLSTHAIKGLSENDFIMAAKIDQILAENEEYSH